MKSTTTNTTEIRLLDAADIRAILGIKCRSVMYNLIAKGVIPPPFKLGGRNRWDARDVQQLIDDLASRPATELTNQG